MVTEGLEWPLPSQSIRVRLLLYLVEGLMLGAGTALLLVSIGGVFTDIDTGSLEFEVSPTEAFIFLLLFVLLLRGIAIVDIGRRVSRDGQPEFQDWWETRRWVWVVAIALPIGGLLLGVSILLWGWWAVVYRQLADLIMIGAFMGGLFLYLYVFHRLGAELH